MLQFDNTFIQQLQNRDPNSFHIFYEQTLDGFFRYIMSHYYFSEAEAQDILGDFYVKCWNALPKYKNAYSFSNYVRTIFKNTIKDTLKKNKNIPFTLLDNDDQSFEDLLVDENSINDLLQQDFEREQIEQAIHQLSQTDQEVIFLKYIEDKSSAQIADIIGLPETSARKRLSRAMQNLRGLLGK